MYSGYNLSKWRIPGVLQYFGIAYLITSSTVLYFLPYSRNEINKLKQSVEMIENPSSFIILKAYYYEWIVQFVILITILCIVLFATAPGCPMGYNGAGGIADYGDYPDCTGGIHRYVDSIIFGVDHYYDEPTCVSLYKCIAYDPEGLLGSFSACILTYFGLMSGRIILHYKDHETRLKKWMIFSCVLLLLGGIMCQFSQNDGLIPLNKNLW